MPSSEVSNFSNITMRSVDPMPRTPAPSYGREARTHSRPNWAANPLKQLTTSSAGSVSGLRRSQSSSISGWSPKEGKAEEVQQLLLENPRRIEQGEPGNLAFGVHRSIDHPGRVLAV